MHGTIGGPMTDPIAKERCVACGLESAAANRSQGIKVTATGARDNGSLDLSDMCESGTYLNVPEYAPTLSAEDRIAVGLPGCWARDEVRGIGFYVRP
jgi:hypothetical protein